MWTEQALLKLSDKTTYCREDLFRIFRSEKQDLRESTFRWTLYNMLQKQEIFRTGYDSYITKRPEKCSIYKPHYSDRARAVMELLEENYSGLNFVMFESVLLNEFLNHQIAQNTMYVQVEKEVSSYIFDVLQEKYNGNILYKPGKKEFDKYWRRGCIVVLELISQAPLSQETPHEIVAEKMLVDIIAEKSIAATFSPSELPFIFENVIGNYQVDKRRVDRYAGRRGKALPVRKYMEGR